MGTFPLTIKFPSTKLYRIILLLYCAYLPFMSSLSFYVPLLSWWLLHIISLVPFQLSIPTLLFGYMWYQIITLNMTGWVNIGPVCLLCSWYFRIFCCPPIHFVYMCASLCDYVMSYTSITVHILGSTSVCLHFSTFFRFFLSDHYDFTNCRKLRYLSIFPTQMP